MTRGRVIEWQHKAWPDGRRLELNQIFLTDMKSLDCWSIIYNGSRLHRHRISGLSGYLVNFWLVPNGMGGRRPNGFLGLSLNDMTDLFLVILLDKTVSVG